MEIRGLDSMYIYAIIMVTGRKIRLFLMLQKENIMLKNIKQKIFCVIAPLFLLLATGCASDRKIELNTDVSEGSPTAVSGILYRGVVAGVMYGEGWAFSHRMRATHESAAKYVLRTAEKNPNNPIIKAKNAGVSPIFGAIDIRSRYLERSYFESAYNDAHPFISTANNLVSDGDLVDFLIYPVSISTTWESILFVSIPLRDSWDDVKSYRAIILRVVCKVTDDACFERESRNYACEDGAMVIDGERQPDRSCGGYGTVSERHASVIGPIAEVYGSFDNYLKYHNIPWDEKCLTQTFDCNRENGNAIPFEGYGEWLKTRPNYLSAQKLATKFYKDEGEWDEKDKVWLKYLSSQMLSSQKAMTKEEFMSAR